MKKLITLFSILFLSIPLTCYGIVSDFYKSYDVLGDNYNSIPPGYFKSFSSGQIERQQIYSWFEKHDISFDFSEGSRYQSLDDIPLESLRVLQSSLALLPAQHLALLNEIGIWSNQEICEVTKPAANGIALFRENKIVLNEGLFEGDLDSLQRVTIHETGHLVGFNLIDEYNNGDNPSYEIISEDPVFRLGTIFFHLDDRYKEELSVYNTSFSNIHEIFASTYERYVRQGDVWRNMALMAEGEDALAQMQSYLFMKDVVFDGREYGEAHLGAIRRGVDINGREGIFYTVNGEENFIYTGGEEQEFFQRLSSELDYFFNIYNSSDNALGLMLLGSQFYQNLYTDIVRFIENHQDEINFDMQEIEQFHPSVLEERIRDKGLEELRNNLTNNLDISEPENIILSSFNVEGEGPTRRAIITFEYDGNSYEYMIVATRGAFSRLALLDHQDHSAMDFVFDNDIASIVITPFIDEEVRSLVKEAFLNDTIGAVEPGQRVPGYIFNSEFQPANPLADTSFMTLLQRQSGWMTGKGGDPPTLYTEMLRLKIDNRFLLFNDDGYTYAGEITSLNREFTININNRRFIYLSPKGDVPRRQIYRLMAVIDEQGIRYEYNYDDENGILRVTGNGQTWVYDYQGNLLEMEGASSSTSRELRNI